MGTQIRIIRKNNAKYAEVFLFLKRFFYEEQPGQDF